MSSPDDDFAAFFHQHSARVVSRLRLSESVPEAVAEEIVQHAMLAIFSVWDEVAPCARVSYLYIAAIRRAWREKAARPPMADLDDVPEPADATWEGEACWPVFLEWLYVPLTGRQRQVVTQRILEDLPTSQVARILGVHPNTVRNDLERALKVMKNRLQEEGEQ